MERTFTNNKFEQLVATITQLRDRGGFDGERVDQNTDFIPLVVIPDAGVPVRPFIEVDLQQRSALLFRKFQPHVFPPGILQLSDLQLFEGIADHYPGDILELIGGWRHAAGSQGLDLQTFLAKHGIQRPLSKHILRTSKSFIESLKVAGA